MKIEAGCKAVIVNSSCGHNGIVVTVLRYFGPPGSGEFKFSCGPIWETDCELVDSWDVVSNLIGENLLKRIDDDSRQITSWDALADIYKPPLRKKISA